MHARVTYFDVDPNDDDLAAAWSAFERLVVPEMRKQAGYEGCYLLRGEGGRGLIVSLWESEDAMRSGEANPFYAEQFERFKEESSQPSLMRGWGRFHVEQVEKLKSVPDREPLTESYGVDYADHPLE